MNSDLIAALEWAAMPAGSGPVGCASIGADVVNLSLGSDARPARLNSGSDVDFVSYVANRLAVRYGTTIVAAIGNSGPIVGQRARVARIGSTGPERRRDLEGLRRQPRRHALGRQLLRLAADARAVRRRHRHPATVGRIVLLAWPFRRPLAASRRRRPRLQHRLGRGRDRRRSSSERPERQHAPGSALRDGDGDVDGSAGDRGQRRAATAGVSVRVRHRAAGRVRARGPAGARVRARARSLDEHRQVGALRVAVDAHDRERDADVPAFGHRHLRGVQHRQHVSRFDDPLRGAKRRRGPARRPTRRRCREGQPRRCGNRPAGRRRRLQHRLGLRRRRRHRATGPPGDVADRRGQGRGGPGAAIRPACCARPRAVHGDVRVRRPAAPSDGSRAIPTGTGGWKIELPGKVSIPRGGDHVVNFKARLPAGAAPGSYTGAVVVRVSNGQTLRIPVFASVALHDAKRGVGTSGSQATVVSARDVFGKADTTWPLGATGTGADWLVYPVELARELTSAVFTAYGVAPGDDTYDLYVYDADFNLVAQHAPVRLDPAGQHRSARERRPRPVDKPYAADAHAGHARARQVLRRRSTGRSSAPPAPAVSAPSC